MSSTPEVRGRDRPRPTARGRDRDGGAAPARKIQGRSPWRLAFERLRKDRAAKIAGGHHRGDRLARPARAG